MQLKESSNKRQRTKSVKPYNTETKVSKSEFSDTAKRRGVKTYLLAAGVRMDEMTDFLLKFFTRYGHTGLENKKLDELQLLASKYFISLKVYTKKFKQPGKKNK